jgi:hypothetical protein
MNGIFVAVYFGVPFYKNGFFASTPWRKKKKQRVGRIGLLAVHVQLEAAYYFLKSLFLRANPF